MTLPPLLVSLAASEKSLEAVSFNVRETGSVG
jgi:hypothetical protein